MKLNTQYPAVDLDTCRIEQKYNNDLIAELGLGAVIELRHYDDLTHANVISIERESVDDLIKVLKAYKRRLK